MKTIYLIWMYNDEINPTLIGAADTYEKAEAMKAKAIDVGFDNMEFDINEFPTNTVTINDIPYTF